MTFQEELVSDDMHTESERNAGHVPVLAADPGGVLNLTQAVCGHEKAHPTVEEGKDDPAPKDLEIEIKLLWARFV